MANIANIVQNGIAGPVYLVDANGNPITSTNGLAVNASFSAASIAINDPTTTSQKMAVDASGNASVKLGAALPAGTNVVGGVELVDSAGTNKASIDANGNQYIRGGFTEQTSLSAGSLNADLVASVDVSAYKSLAIQVNGTFVGTLSFQWSNDNSNWVSLSTFYGSANTQPVSSTTGTGLWISSVVARYLRIRMTAYTSGTATGVLELYTHSANAYPSVNALAAQSGTWTSQLLDSAGTNKASIDSSGNVHIQSPDTSTSGTVTNNNDAVSIALPGGQATALVQITGTFVGTLNFEASPDSGTTWYAVQASLVGASTLATTATSPGAWRINIAGFTNLRVRLSPATSGTATIGLRLSAGVHNVFVNNATTLGQAVMANSAPVVIASDQSNLPVKGATTELSGLSAGSLNADLVPSTDVSAYEWLVLQIAPNAYSGTLTFAFSNDNTNFIACNGVRLDTDNANTAGSAITANNQLWGFFKKGRYFRVRMTAYTSGTAQGTLEMYGVAPPYAYTISLAAQSGTWTVQPGNTPNTSAWLVNQPSSDITVFASGAQTTTQTQADQTNNVAKGIKVVLDMTNVASSPSVTLEIDGKDAASGKYYSILTGAAVTTVSTNVYTVYPGLTASANAVANDILPHTWRIKVTANNANSGTYSVGASLIP